MQGLIRCVAVAGLLLGCDGDDTTAPVDVPPGTSGLVVTWSAQPEAWPGQLDDGVTLERATFALDSLRVVGDAGPGDPRTTASGLLIQWDDAIQPPDIAFSEAPIGLYSQLSVLLDGGVSSSSFELRGHVNVEGTDYEFRIDDSESLAINLSIDEMLTPPDAVTLEMRVNFANALDVIDWATVDNESGRLQLETGDAQMPAFRAKLIESITVNASDG